MFFGAGPTHGAWLGVPLRSATIGSPTESAAVMNARSAGAMSRSATRNTGTGPLVPASGPAERIGLRSLEIRQHIPEAPTGVAEVRPAVVVSSGATQPDAAIHRRRSPDDPRAREGERILGLASGEREPPAMRVRPDVRGVEELRRPGGGVGAVIRPSLQQQHRPSGVLGQPVGEDAPSRAGADENRVVLGMGTVVHVRCDRPVTSMAAPEASATRPSSSRLLSMALVLVPRRIDLIAAIIRANWNCRSAPSVDKPRAPF